MDHNSGPPPSPRLWLHHDAPEPRHHPRQTPQASLEGLPAEIRIQIIHEITDIPTLRSLAHATPSYHVLYRLDREHLWTNIVRQHLNDQKIHFLDEGANCIQLHLLNNEPLDPVTEEHLQTYFQARQEHGSHSLTIPQCKALLRIIDSVSWKIGLSPTGQTVQIGCSRTPFEDPYSSGPALREVAQRGAPLIVHVPKTLYPCGYENYRALSLVSPRERRVGIAILNSRQDPQSLDLWFVGKRGAYYGRWSSLRG